MERNARLPRDPTHPMRVFLPLGLFATSLIFDLIRLFSENGIWSVLSEYMIGAGIAGALLGAAFGTADWIATPRNTAHPGAHIIATGMFVASWLLRLRTPADPPAAALLLSALAVFVALGSRRLGSEAAAAGSFSGHPTLSR